MSLSVTAFLRIFDSVSRTDVFVVVTDDFGTAFFTGEKTGFGDSRINILAASPVFFPLKNGKKHPVSCRIRISATLPEDISFGTPLGYGDIYVDDFCCGSVELISGQALSSKKSAEFCPLL